MEIPDKMISDAIKKLAGYKFYMAKKVKSENAKTVDEPKEQHVSPVKSKRGKIFRCYGDQVVNVPNKPKKDVLPRRTRSLSIAKETVIGEHANSFGIRETNTQRHRRSQLRIDSQIDDDSSDTNSDAILCSSSSDDIEESANETDDADESDMDLSDDNPDGDDDDAGYGALLDETPANELTNFMSHPMYTNTQTTLVVHNSEENPELTSYISGASKVPLGTHVDVLATKTLLQEMFLDENTHHKPSLPLKKIPFNSTTPLPSSLQAKAKKLMQKAKQNMRKINFKKEDSIIDFFKAEMSTRTEGNVYSDLRIKSIVRVVVKKKWGYSFLTSNVVRRFDDKEYEFSYADLFRLSLNDVEDMYLLQVQDKLYHLPLEFVKDFNNALILFIKRVML
nr:hypothetical protein [Tanacetum cinerariifolium]